MKKKELKKLFICCPTDGRELTNIINTRDRMHRIAEAMFDQELDVINDYPVYVPEDITGRKQTAYIYGKEVVEIAHADYFIGIYDSIYFEDCSDLAVIARACDIPTTYVSVFDIAPDAVDIASREFVENHCKLD